jgi:hypothetical protein
VAPLELDGDGGYGTWRRPGPEWRRQQGKAVTFEVQAPPAQARELNGPALVSEAAAAAEAMQREHVDRLDPRMERSAIALFDPYFLADLAEKEAKSKHLQSEKKKLGGSQEGARSSVASFLPRSISLLSRPEPAWNVHSPLAAYSVLAAGPQQRPASARATYNGFNGAG